MSDSYANEFEKWLENSPDTGNIDVTEGEDSSDESANCSENTVNNLESESESEKLQKHLPYGWGTKLSLGLINDQAPILVDDDDDDDGPFPIKKLQYEDEPPVLEPVTSELQCCKISAVRSPQLSPQICIHNYSKSNQISSRRHKRQKTYSNKDKINYLSSDVCDKSSHIDSLYSKDCKSDNIFDKFSSDHYDFPPPLIPSPEALQIHSESLSSLAQSHSPDFCAMEADSTSEISGFKLGSVFRSHRLSKNSVHDVSVECDSTCMLAASPVIVSPASISNGEIEETVDSGDGRNKDRGLESRDYKLKECDNALNGKTENEDQSLVIQTEMDKCSADEAVYKDSSEFKYFVKEDVLQITDDMSSHPVPLILETPSSSDYKLLSISVKNDTLNSGTEYCTDPPILSAVSPPAVRSHTKLRKTRHTVDTPETYLRLRKRVHAKSSLQAVVANALLDVSTPPILTRVSETVVPTFSGRRSRTVSEQSKNECLSCCEDKSVSHRRKRRCNSLPVASATDYSNSLPENLRSFFVGTSLLSDLQTHMHRLLYNLFPQLKIELNTMCPESAKFESLLYNLVKLLEQPDDPDNLAPPTLTLCRDLKPTSISECPRLVSITSELDYMSQNISDEPSSSSVSISDSQAAADYAKHVLKTDAISHNHTSLSNLSSNYLYNDHHNQHVKIHPDDDKDLIRPLSQLTVRDLEEILTPSKVLLCKDPELLLEKFVRLSCQTLQLLLPDLTVSVHNELAHSPKDLIAFINNVTLTNSRRQSKKY